MTISLPSQPVAVPRDPITIHLLPLQPSTALSIDAIVEDWPTFLVTHEVGSDDEIIP